LKYFKLSADQDHRGGKLCYGLCLFEGRGVSVDSVTAAQYLKLSAYQNDSMSQSYHGRLSPSDVYSKAEVFKLICLKRAGISNSLQTAMIVMVNFVTVTVYSKVEVFQ
jgi:TPR repeat protein